MNCTGCDCTANGTNHWLRNYNIDATTIPRMDSVGLTEYYIRPWDYSTAILGKRVPSYEWCRDC